MKIIAWLIAGAAMLVVAVVVIGSLLPKQHVARVRAQYSVSAERVYDAIADVEQGTAWRTGLQKVEVLEREPLRWRETAEWGTLVFVRDEAVRPTRIVTRIADEDQGFGGTWTYEIATSSDLKTVLTITENGTVSNPLFRFMSRFVFGHYNSLETFTRDLGQRLGEAVEPVRVP